MKPNRSMNDIESLATSLLLATLAVMVAASGTPGASPAQLVARGVLSALLLAGAWFAARLGLRLRRAQVRRQVAPDTFSKVSIEERRRSNAA